MRLSVNTKIIIGVLVACLLMGAIGWISTGFTDFTKDGISGKFEPTVNEDNFFNVECVTLKSGNSGDGVTVTVNDDGSVKVKGKNENKTDSLEYTIGTVTLEPGTYTFTALDGASKNGSLVVAVDGETEYCADFGENTFTLDSETELVIKLVIKPDVEINSTVYPVIVEGDEPGDFYK